MLGRRRTGSRRRSRSPRQSGAGAGQARSQGQVPDHGQEPGPEQTSSGPEQASGHGPLLGPGRGAEAQGSEGAEGAEAAQGAQGAEGVERGQGVVVVGLCGSPADPAALRAAAREARATGRRLVAVVAWEPPGGEAGYMLRPDPVWAEYGFRQARDRMERAFDAAFGGVPPRGVGVERRLVRDQAWRALCAAADGPHDRLVLGVRAGRRGLFRHDGTTRRVLARATCPVLTVPAPRFPRRLRAALRRATASDFDSASRP